MTSSCPVPKASPPSSSPASPSPPMTSATLSPPPPPSLHRLRSRALSAAAGRSGTSITSTAYCSAGAATSLPSRVRAGTSLRSRTFGLPTMGSSSSSSSPSLDSSASPSCPSSPGCFFVAAGRRRLPCSRSPPLSPISQGWEESSPRLLLLLEEEENFAPPSPQPSPFEAAAAAAFRPPPLDRPVRQRRRRRGVALVPGDGRGALKEAGGSAAAVLFSFPVSLDLLFFAERLERGRKRRRQGGGGGGGRSRGCRRPFMLKRHLRG